jgi:hypothetical protein
MTCSKGAPVRRAAHAETTAAVDIFVTLAIRKGSSDAIGRGVSRSAVPDAPANRTRPFSATYSPGPCSHR